MPPPPQPTSSQPLQELQPEFQRYDSAFEANLNRALYRQSQRNLVATQKELAMVKQEVEALKNIMTTTPAWGPGRVVEIDERPAALNTQRAGGKPVAQDENNRISVGQPIALPRAHELQERVERLSNRIKVDTWLARTPYPVSTGKKM